MAAPCICEPSNRYSAAIQSAAQSLEWGKSPRYGGLLVRRWDCPAHALQLTASIALFMIELKNVQKSYDGGATLAVADTSLTIERGEFLGLIGASGCGKTTTLKMINRLEESSSGEILVNGRNVIDQNPEQLRRNIGYVFQDARLFPHMNVRRNLEYGTRRNRRTEARNPGFDDVVDVLALGALLGRQPHGLSGGERQRVARHREER